METEGQAFDKPCPFQFTTRGDHASSINSYEILNLTLNFPIIASLCRAVISKLQDEELLCDMIEKSLTLSWTHILLRE